MYQANGKIPSFFFLFSFSFGGAPKCGRLVIAKTADTEKGEKRERRTHGQVENSKENENDDVSGDK